eukprot:6181070-Pleurochrysis_carterae.AAC.1
MSEWKSDAHWRCPLSVSSFFELWKTSATDSNATHIEEGVRTQKAEPLWTSFMPSRDYRHNEQGRTARPVELKKVKFSISLSSSETQTQAHK